MELFSVFVTGANRGIGLEFVRQLSELDSPPFYIFASYRSEDGTQALQNIRDNCKKSQIVLIKMDITKKDDIEAARILVEDKVGEKGLTLLINNAGVLVDQGFPKVTEENLNYHYRTNAIAPVMIFQEFLPLLQRAAALRKSDTSMSVNRAAVVNISALLGSITVNLPPCMNGFYAFGYRMSKAALNMAMRTIAATVKDQGILVVMMCPGWVKTDMGTERAAVEVNHSISAMLQTFQRLDETHHGTFMDRNGKNYEF